MLRYRGNKKVLNKVKEFDAFPKVPETYVESTPVGGTLSVFTFIFILWLVYSEVSYYLDSKLVFKFVPDQEYDAKLSFNIDMTIAMPCSNIGADILDSTSQSVFGFGELQEEDTWWEMSPEQKHSFESLQYLNSYLREEYHAVANLLWKSGQSAVTYTMPPHNKDIKQKKHDACRLHGSLILNKVAGNFHVTTGKSLHLPRGHVHLNLMFDSIAQNFSHRINKLSFGDNAPGIIHPLEGDEKITNEENMLYQYFIDVVPTDVDTTFSRMKTYQYSVKEYNRPISHDKGSHGIPGIFIKYGMAALKLRVYQERDNVVQFSLRLFAVVGGIYIIVGFINNVINTIKSMIFQSSSPKPTKDINIVKKEKNSLFDPSVVADISITQLPVLS